MPDLTISQMVAYAIAEHFSMTDSRPELNDDTEGLDDIIEGYIYALHEGIVSFTQRWNFVEEDKIEYNQDNHCNQ